MNWKSHNKKQKHVAGDIRITSYFCILPTRCLDGHTYWLEKIQVRQHYGYLFAGWYTDDYLGKTGVQNDSTN